MIVMIIIAVIVVLIVLIVYLNHDGSVKSQGREEYLKKLANFVEGKIEKLQDVENAYKIEYDFDGVKFVYEDSYVQGFSREPVNKGYLRAFSRSAFTLSFSEKMGNQKIVSGQVIIASNIPDEIPDDSESKVVVPEDLKDFRVHVSDPGFANKLLADEKVVNIFRKFKNIDQRGFPSLPLRITDGIIILDFSSELGVRPNLQELKGNVPLIEDISEKLLYIVSAINKLLK